MADIPASIPIVTPAVPAQTYPLWIVESLTFSGNGIERPLTAEAWFRSARRDVTNPSGWVLGDQRRNYHIPDVWVLAYTDADVATSMSALVATLTRLATAAGVL